MCMKRNKANELYAESAIALIRGCVMLRNFSVLAARVKISFDHFEVKFCGLM